MGSNIARDEAKIVLRLDTAQAERDLAKFTGSVRGATARIGLNVSGAGRAIGQASGGGRGPLGLSGGGLAGLAVGAEFALPILGDLHKIASGVLGGLGKAASVSLGLSAAARTAEVPNRAVERGIQLSGLGALGASKEQNQAIYQLVHDMERMRAEAANKFESDVNGKRTEDVVEWFKKHVLQIIEILIAIKIATMVGSAVKGVTRGLL